MASSPASSPEFSEHGSDEFLEAEPVVLPLIADASTTLRARSGSWSSKTSFLPHGCEGHFQFPITMAEDQLHLRAMMLRGHEADEPTPPQRMANYWFTLR